MRIVACLNLMILAASSAFSQQGQESPPDYTRINIQPGTTAEVALPAGYQHWIVGASASAGTADWVDVADTSFPIRRVLRLPPSRPDPITPHPSSEMNVSGTSISVSGGGDTLCMFLGFSTPRTLNLAMPNGSTISLPIDASGVVIEDGVVQSAPLGGDGGVVVAALTCGMTSLSPVLTAGGENQVVDWKFLRSHLTRYIAFQKAAPGQWGFTGIKVQIGAEGAVQSASCNASLASAIAAACVSAAATIQQWAFQPFLVSGQPAPVSAWVMVMIARDGSISSSLSPDANQF